MRHTSKRTSKHNYNGKMAILRRFLVIVVCCLLRTISESNKFDPYVDNGGTIVGISGRNFAIIASDSRLSESYIIRSRNVSKIFEVSDGVYLAASGCLSDTLALSNVLRHNSRLYEWQNERSPTVTVLAHLLATVLYSRRSFPYFSFCAVAGLDEHGCGALYRYDAVGSFERVRAVCCGKGEKLIQPLLDDVTGMEADDSLFAFPRMDGSQSRASLLSTAFNTATHNLNVDQACELIVRAFQAAAEREISIGDGIEMCIIQAEEDTTVTAGASTTSTPAAREEENSWRRQRYPPRATCSAVTIQRRSFSLPRH